jgi:hypothetical protein
MHFFLCRFGDSQVQSLDYSITGSLERRDDTLQLTYYVRGISSLYEDLKPNSLPASFIEGKKLYEQNCFELFMKKSESSEYIEYNFGASKEWNYYLFESPRKAMKNFLHEIPTDDLAISYHQNASEEEVVISIDLPIPQYFLGGDQLQFGVSSIINNVEGKKDYWALYHSSQVPNFHQFSDFTLHL